MVYKSVATASIKIPMSLKHFCSCTPPDPLLISNGRELRLPAVMMSVTIVPRVSIVACTSAQLINVVNWLSVFSPKITESIEALTNVCDACGRCLIALFEADTNV